MRVEHGDLWTYHSAGYWVVIPTNCQVNARGYAVMGAGLAKAAADRHSRLAWQYGQELQSGQIRSAYARERLILLPTKGHWQEPSSLELIRAGCEWLIEWLGNEPDRIALPQLGCGLGGLDWATQVRPIFEEILTDNRFVIVLPEDR